MLSELVAFLLTTELDHCSNVLMCFPGPPRNKCQAVLCVSLTYGPCSKIPCLPTDRRIRKIWCRGESAHRGQGLPTHRTEGFRPCAAGFRFQYTYVTVRSTRFQLRITPGPKAPLIANHEQVFAKTPTHSGDASCYRNLVRYCAAQRRATKPRPQHARSRS